MCSMDTTFRRQLHVIVSHYCYTNTSMVKKGHHVWLILPLNFNISKGEGYETHFGVFRRPAKSEKEAQNIVDTLNLD